MKITPKQQSRLDEFDRKVRELRQSDHKNETSVDFGYRHLDEFNTEIITATDWEHVKDFLLESMQIAVTEERAKIKENIIDFAIQGKFDKDEMKGLSLYTKIINYFNSLTTEE